MTKRSLLGITLTIATVGAWAVFLYLDSLWSACLRSAVDEGKKVYGEMYGPLSFFRPATMWIAAALSVVSVAWLGIIRRPIQQPPETTRGNGP